MAINVDQLPAYIEEKKSDILLNAVLKSKTAKEFGLQSGVKDKTAINILNTEVSFGSADSCQWDEAGTSTLSQRYITPGHIKVNQSFCPATLAKTYLNWELRYCAGQSKLPAQDKFIDGVVQGVQDALEKALWNGDTSTGQTNPNLNKFDGMVKILGEAEAASGLASVYEITSADTVSAVINKVVAGVPTEAYNKGEIVLYCSAKNYRKFIQELIANGNIVFKTMSDAEGANAPQDIIVPGTNVRVIPVGGLDYASKDWYVASYRDNFIYGTDMENDSEVVEFFYSKDNRQFRLAIEFVAGVQVAFPDQISVAHA